MVIRELPQHGELYQRWLFRGESRPRFLLRRQPSAKKIDITIHVHTRGGVEVESHDGLLQWFVAMGGEGDQTCR